VKNNYDKRFGGRTRKSWTSKDECLEDEEAFLFSLDLNKKYLINEDKK
jgi:hypothetical protein